MEKRWSKYCGGADPTRSPIESFKHAPQIIHGKEIRVAHQGLCPAPYFRIGDASRQRGPTSSLSGWILPRANPHSPCQHNLDSHYFVINWISVAHFPCSILARHKHPVVQRVSVTDYVVGMSYRVMDFFTGELLEQLPPSSTGHLFYPP